MSPEGRRVAILVTAAWILAGLAATPAMAQASSAASLEYSVKANYLIRFAAFVEWPSRVFAHAQSPIVICVAGRDPFGTALDRAARGRTAYGRPLTVRRLAASEAVVGCHILYVGQGAENLPAAAAEEPGLLVVTDAATAPTRGAIHFVLSDTRVRFHIDQQAAMRSGLAISSRLLNLALSVRAG